MTTNKPFVTQIVAPELAAKLRHDLVEKGFTLTVPEHTHFSAKGVGVSCTLYLSGKLVVQGKEAGPFLEFYLEPEILHTFSHTHPEATLQVDLTPRIGMDESGKGDFFGPLAIAGVYAADDEVVELARMGVCDSKTLSDSAVGRLAPAIEKLCLHHAVVISPSRYNEMYESFRNLNQLLAWGHATVMEQLVMKSGCQNVILDQFAYGHVMETALKRQKLEISLTQRHRAEEDVVVAAASILARHHFLKSLQELSRRYEITLPKGASPAVIQAGRQFVTRYGSEELPHVAKMHFKTAAVII